MILTKLVKSAFSVVFEIFLWIIFLGPAVAGIAMSGGLSSGSQYEAVAAGSGIVSILLLLIAGFIVAVLIGGLVSIFLGMSKNIEQLLGKKISE